MYVLYGGDYTRSAMVRWMLEEAGTDFDFRRIDILKGEHRAPGFLAMNPAGVVPVLVTPEGQVLTETVALMLYLADRHGMAALAPPADDPARGPFLSALMHVACDIQPEMKRFHYPHRYVVRAEDVGRVQDMAREMVTERLGVVEARLAAAGPYLLGSRFTMADALACYWVAWLGHEEAASRHPRLGRMYGLVRERPGIGAVLAETEAMAVRYTAMMQASPGGVIA